MKPGLWFLNSKETKEVKRKLDLQFGFSDIHYAFLMNDNNKIFIVNRDVDRLNLKVLRINTIGVYFGEDYGDEVRLSIEGSQIVGPHAIKGVVELTREDAREWIKGSDLEHPGSTKGFVIIKSGNDYIGCAKHKEGKLLNHVPKERRIKASD